MLYVIMFINDFCLVGCLYTIDCIFFLNKLVKRFESLKALYKFSIIMMMIIMMMMMAMMIMMITC